MSATPPPAVALRPPLLTVVVPTYREVDNVAELVTRVARALEGIDWEIVFVDDDSPDGTAQAVRELARLDARVRCLQRIGRRGLSSACVEGMLCSSAPLLAVMDADLQHDETLLPRMVAELQLGDVDLVVGSRYVDGGSIGDWDLRRARISSLALRLGRLVVPPTLHDPLSGFFMLRREALMGSVRLLSGVGFKILVDLFASSPAPIRFRELPFTFRCRRAGQSKLDNQAAWDYAMLLLDKAFGRWVPVRFIAFSLIGGAGVLVHMGVLGLLLHGAGMPFGYAQAGATAAAMVCNFTVNNLITYRDRQLRGWHWLRGLASFMAACGIGAVANVGIAQALFERQTGWALAALAGIAVGAIWNYAVTSVVTWRHGHGAARAGTGAVRAKTS